MKLVISAFICFLLTFSLIYAITSTPNGNFSVTPNEIMLNWTNNYRANATISFLTVGDVTVEVMNSTSVLTANYSQPNEQTYCSNSYKLFVINVNQSNEYNNTITNSSPYSGMMTVVDDVFQFNHKACSPGRYSTSRFTFRDANTPNETANISVIIDIPISSYNNPELASTYTSSFSGTLPPNASYHSYFFNTTEIANATALAINLTGWSSNQDVDVFLLDNNNNLKAKSINTSTEYMVYSFLPSQQAFWEIRVSGFSSSSMPYSGSLIFSTLNSSKRSFDIGVVNVSDLTQTTFSLTNEGSLDLTITESKVLYHVDRFAASSSRNFTFFVPTSDIVSKVKVSLNWTGNSNYSFNLYNKDGILVASSANKHLPAKYSNVMQEEFNETTQISSGIWRLEVKNVSKSEDAYTVEIYQYVSPSNWISTNFTSTTLNPHTSSDVELNITIPNTSWDGIYEGYLEYVDSRNVGIRLPISINVTTPVLLINSTLSSNQIYIKDNYGRNSTRYVLLPINNTGFYNLSITMLNSSQKLYGSGSYTANFTFNQITSIPRYGSDMLSINISFNDSLPKGTYTGWIYINATNDNENFTSHPQSAYNISITLDLTDELEVRILEIISKDGDRAMNNSNVNENVTARFKIFLMDGTEVGASNPLSTSNFWIWLSHTNFSYRIPSSGSLSLYNHTNPIYIDDYQVNFTVPSGYLGGLYSVYLNLTWITGSAIYRGQGFNSSFIINNTALSMSTPNSTNIKLSIDTDYGFFINITNYGEKAYSSYTVKLNESCSGYDISATSAVGDCYESKSGSTFTISPKAYSSSCGLLWTISSGSSNASACKSYIIVSPTTGWVDPAKINVTVTVSTSSSQQQQQEEEPIEVVEEEEEEEEVASKFFTVNYTDLISIEQGENKTVSLKVTNENETHAQSVKLSILLINSTWYKVSPSNAYSVQPEDSYIYRILFAIPEDVDIKDYNGQFKAESKDYTKTGDFKLRVLPGSKLKAKINKSLAIYENETLALELKLNETRSKGGNISSIESKIKTLRDMIAEAKGYVITGDYRSAYFMLDTIKQLIENVSTEEKQLMTGKTFLGAFNWFIAVVILVSAIVAGVIVYLFWPVGVKFNLKKIDLNIFKSKKPKDSQLKEIKEALKKKKTEESKQEESTDASKTDLDFFN